PPDQLHITHGLNRQTSLSQADEVGDPYRQNRQNDQHQDPPFSTSSASNNAMAPDRCKACETAAWEIFSARAASCWGAPVSRAAKSRRSRACIRATIWSRNTNWLVTASVSSGLSP